MNAAVLAYGHCGRADGARADLEAFWRSVFRAAECSPLRRTPLDVLLGRWTLDYSAVFVATDLAARLFSPYDLNPGGSNPLRDILAETVDIERLAREAIQLFVTATNVRTGPGRVSRNSEIIPEVLLASACLPTLFQAVEIDGEPIGTGGYSGNPTITPLVRGCKSPTRSWSRSTRSSGPARRARPATSSTG
jgi:NTE family protein